MRLELFTRPGNIWTALDAQICKAHRPKVIPEVRLQDLLCELFEANCSPDGYEAVLLNRPGEHGRSYETKSMFRARAVDSGELY